MSRAPGGEDAIFHVLFSTYIAQPSRQWVRFLNSDEKGGKSMHPSARLTSNTNAPFSEYVALYFWFEMRPAVQSMKDYCEIFLQCWIRLHACVL